MIYPHIRHADGENYKCNNGPQLDNFVSKLIESGRYGSTSEVMRSALRLLEQQENQTAALKQAIEAGENSGESTLSLKDIAAQVKQKYQ